MQAVILAGGLGTRLGDLTRELPKPMVPVGGKPFLEHMITRLAGQGFDRILLLVGYKAEVIEGHFGDGSSFGTSIRYSREEQPLGTGGALKRAEGHLESRFLLLFGDVLRLMDYGAFFHRHAGSCLAIYPYDERGMTTIACGNVGIDDHGRVSTYRKGDHAARLPYVDAGFGLFERRLTEWLPDGPCSFEERVYDRLAQEGGLEYDLLDRDFFDIGNLADLERAKQHFGG